MFLFSDFYKVTWSSNIKNNRLRLKMQMNIECLLIFEMVLDKNQKRNCSLLVTSFWDINQKLKNEPFIFCSCSHFQYSTLKNFKVYQKNGYKFCIYLSYIPFCWYRTKTRKGTIPFYFICCNFLSNLTKHIFKHLKIAKL